MRRARDCRRGGRIETVSRNDRSRPIWAAGRVDAGWFAVIALASLALVLAAGDRPRPADRATTPRRTPRPCSPALFASGLAIQLQIGARLQSDAFYYFAYLRSIAFDRDVNFMNDYRMLGLADKPTCSSPRRPATRTRRGPSGRRSSGRRSSRRRTWSADAAARASGRAVATDGTSYPYRQAMCIAGLFYALLGIWFAIRAGAAVLPAGASPATAAALTIGGSFMLWYTLAEPTMTHAPTMAAVAGFVWYWTATGAAIADPLDRPRRAGRLRGLVRWQSVIFALLPAIEALVALWRAGAAVTPRPSARRSSAASPSWGARPSRSSRRCWPGRRSTASTWRCRRSARRSAGRIRISSTSCSSSQNGLFATSPILYVAASGSSVRAPAAGRGVPALVAIAAMIYFNASIQDWWGSAGYGGRRFDGTCRCS